MKRKKFKMALGMKRKKWALGMKWKVKMGIWNEGKKVKNGHLE